jgi:hypothetical protein
MILSNLDRSNPYIQATFDLNNHHILLLAYYEGRGMALNFPVGDFVYLVSGEKKTLLLKYQNFCNQTEAGQLPTTQYYVMRFHQLWDKGYNVDYIHAQIVYEMLRRGMVDYEAMDDAEVQKLVKEAQEGSELVWDGEKRRTSHLV